MTPKELSSKINLDVGGFFFENALPFNAVESPSFVNMCRAIGSYGRGFKPPTMYELRSWILKKELETTENIVEDIKKTWSKTGVSILSDVCSKVAMDGACSGSVLCSTSASPPASLRSVAACQRLLHHPSTIAARQQLLRVFEPLLHAFAKHLCALPTASSPRPAAPTGCFASPSLLGNLL
ncbi:unnamed protein product [Fraxinus pennsylvanica]|uniref:Uncharacterized protein n=1 Tax=Fraxinus pennsylvanica TaxID=56036 RepID=A0AAD1ZZW4_9LAMI|nr:unnamed protein product [Fraxinus pennsylvanica]